MENEIKIRFFNGDGPEYQWSLFAQKLVETSLSRNSVSFQQVQSVDQDTYVLKRSSRPKIWPHENLLPSDAHYIVEHKGSVFVSVAESDLQYLGWHIAEHRRRDKYLELKQISGVEPKERSFYQYICPLLNRALNPKIIS